MDRNHSRKTATATFVSAAIAGALWSSWLVLGLFAPAVRATPIATQFVRSTPSFFDGVAFDNVTGSVYELPGYGPDSSYGRTGNTFTAYSSIAQFEAGTASASVTTASTWGTYAVAQGGELYARTATTLSGGYPIDAQTTAFSALSGATLQTVNPPNLGGDNFQDSFDWGGFSAVNALSDGGNLYVVSHTLAGAPGDWTIDTYDFALNLLDTSQVTLTIGRPGFAFAIDGSIFFGDDSFSGHISSRVDPFSGALSSVDFTLGPLGGNPYVSNTAYSAATDTLYLLSAGNYYKIVDASAAFGLAVPEPGTLALTAVGVVALQFGRRRRPGRDRQRRSP